MLATSRRRVRACTSEMRVWVFLLSFLLFVFSSCGPGWRGGLLPGCCWLKRKANVIWGVKDEALTDDLLAEALDIGHVGWFFFLLSFFPVRKAR